MEPDVKLRLQQQADHWGERYQAGAECAIKDRKDKCGVGSVQEVTPREELRLEQLMRFLSEHRHKQLQTETASSSCVAPIGARKDHLRILDFGCGDGRYLPCLFRIGQRLNIDITLVGLEISEAALEVHAQRFLDLAKKFDRPARVSRSSGTNDCAAGKMKFIGQNNIMTCYHICTKASDSPEDVQRILEDSVNLNDSERKSRSSGGHLDEPIYDVVIVGWGSLSCIPDPEPLSDRIQNVCDVPYNVLKKYRQSSFLKMFANVASGVFNVVSSKNNHIPHQRRFDSMRQALKEVESWSCSDPRKSAIENYLLGKLKFGAHTDNSFYYTAARSNEKQSNEGKNGRCKVDAQPYEMFWSSVDHAEETERMRWAGFDTHKIWAANVINFQIILYHEKRHLRDINEHFLNLVERGDAQWANTFLNKLVTLCYDRLPEDCVKSSTTLDVPGRGLRDVIRGDPDEAVNQVARYFISVGISKHFRT